MSKTEEEEVVQYLHLASLSIGAAIAGRDLSFINGQVALDVIEHHSIADRSVFLMKEKLEDAVAELERAAVARGGSVVKFFSPAPSSSSPPSPSSFKISDIETCMLNLKTFLETTPLLPVPVPSPPVPVTSHAENMYIHVKRQLLRKHVTAGQLFNEMDTDRSGQISFTEFKLGMDMIGIRPALNSTDMHALFEMFDVDNTRSLTWQEVLTAVQEDVKEEDRKVIEGTEHAPRCAVKKERTEEEKGEDKKRVLRLKKRLLRKHSSAGTLFAQMDSDKGGRISFAEFARGVAFAGIRPLPTDEDVHALYDMFDTDGDRALSWKEVEVAIEQEGAEDAMNLHGANCSDEGKKKKVEGIGHRGAKNPLYKTREVYRGDAFYEVVISSLEKSNGGVNSHTPTIGPAVNIGNSSSAGRGERRREGGDGGGARKGGGGGREEATTTMSSFMKKLGVEEKEEEGESMEKEEKEEKEGKEEKEKEKRVKKEKKEKKEKKAKRETKGKKGKKEKKEKKAKKAKKIDEKGESINQLDVSAITDVTSASESTSTMDVGPPKITTTATTATVTATAAINTNAIVGANAAGAFSVRRPSVLTTHAHSHNDEFLKLHAQKKELQENKAISRIEEMIPRLTMESALHEELEEIHEHVFHTEYRATTKSQELFAKRMSKPLPRHTYEKPPTPPKSDSNITGRQRPKKEESGIAPKHVRKKEDIETWVKKQSILERKKGHDLQVKQTAQEEAVNGNMFTLSEASEAMVHMVHWEGGGDRKGGGGGGEGEEEGPKKDVLKTLYNEGMKAVEKKKEDPKSPYSHRPTAHLENEVTQQFYNSTPKTKDSFMLSIPKPEPVELVFAPTIPEESKRMVESNRGFNAKARESEFVDAWVKKSVRFHEEEKGEGLDEMVYGKYNHILDSHRGPHSPRKKSRETIRARQEIDGIIIPDNHRNPHSPRKKSREAIRAQQEMDGIMSAEKKQL